MRTRVRWAATAALAAALLALSALPASADPDVIVDGHNGRVVASFAAPGNPACEIEVAVDFHRGILAGESTAAYRGGVARVTKLGPNVLRTNLRFVRVGAVVGGPDVTDSRLSNDNEGRDNGFSPNLAINSGNVTKNITGYTDWLLNVDADPTTPAVDAEDFQVRGGGEFRCTDLTLHAFSLLSNPTSNDA